MAQDETKISSDMPSDPFAHRQVAEGYGVRRGKQFPLAQATWGQRDGMGKSHDPSSGKAVLDNAEK